jgi:hypothetical protein
VVEYADGWMPIVYEGLDFGAQMQELERLCQAAGRPTAGDGWHLGDRRAADGTMR